MNTLFVGRTLISLDSTESTNNYTTQLSRQSVIKEGTVVTANHQTAGRGQREKHWQSPPDLNLLMSVYLTPKFVKADEQFRLTELAALAVKQSVDELLPSQSTIKWPNDILVEGRKIAGILIESTVQKNQLARCIIGIGINVNQTNFDASLGATSLKLELGRFVPIDHVLSLVCEALESLYLLAKRQPLAIHKAYEREMYKLNERVDFQIGDIRANYEVQGVNKFGLIQLKNGTGESRFYHFHEARFIRE